MPWDEKTNFVLEIQLKTAALIERCQTVNLITPEDRREYFNRLNENVHSTIETILTSDGETP